MKWLVWLLVLANVALFAYFNIDVVVPKVEVASKELSPEKLRLLNQKDIETLPKKEVLNTNVAAVSAIEQATGCYKWGNFTTTNLPSAQVVLVRLGLQADVNQEPINPQDKRFWVYYPPLKTAELAHQKANEIRALGIEELYVVQDSQWRNAISFGLFSDEHLASNLLAELEAKGVNRATKALRATGNALSSLLIKAVTPEAAQELHKIKNEFVGTEVTPAACP